MPRLNADDWLDILSNRYRRRILRLCSIRPCYPQEIAEILKITPAAVIKHLAELEKRNLVVKREEVRSEGGRNIQYYYVPFRPRFNFNLASNDLIDIEIEDDSDKSVPKTHSRDKILSRDNFTENDLQNLKENYKILVKHEQEKVEAFKKLRQMQYEQERFFRDVQSKNSSQERLLFKIIRFLLDRYRFDNSFTHKDLMDALGIDLESVEEIIQILANDLQVISKISKDTDSSLPTWTLSNPETKHQLDYQ